MRRTHLAELGEAIPNLEFDGDETNCPLGPELGRVTDFFIVLADFFKAPFKPGEPSRGALGTDGWLPVLGLGSLSGRE